MEYRRSPVVTSVFVIDFQQDIQEGFTETSMDSMPTSPPSETTSTPTAHMETLQHQLRERSVDGTCHSRGIGSRLCLTILRKQWLIWYDQIGMGGTLTQPSRHRYRKANGMAAWNFDIMMEALPVMLQIALLPFCHGLSRSMWSVNQTVAAAIIATLSLGFLFYVSIVSSFGCSFITTSAGMGGIGDALTYSSCSGAVCRTASWFKPWPRRSNDST